MFKKHYLSILIGLLLAICLINVPFGIAWYRTYIVCRGKLSDEWKYQYTASSYDSYHQTIAIVFENETEGVACYFSRDGSDVLMPGWSLYP